MMLSLNDYLITLDNIKNILLIYLYTLYTQTSLFIGFLKNDHICSTSQWSPVL